jgi:2-polyprenyl-3-methyl-5-hydroxy-6-metoxy-1,4-benzoquinol methylase
MTALRELAQCPSCGWEPEFLEGVPILLSRADRDSQAFAAYAENYDRIAEDDLSASIQPMRYLEVQADTLSSYLGDLAGLDVCELGVGRGLLLDRLIASDAKTVTGVDVSLPYLSRYAGGAAESNGRLRLAVANAELLPYVEAFDLVVASEILEHVLNAGDFLISLHRSLRPGARTLVRVPYQEDLRQYARQNGCEYPFVHLRTFTKDSFESMMRKADFKPVRMYFDGQFGARLRRPMHSLYPLLRPYLRRVLDPEGMPRRPLRGVIPQLLFRPVTLTGIFERA